MLRVPILLLLALAVLGAAPVPDEGDELVAEFRRYYSKDKSPSERFEAVQVLAGIDSTNAARALVEVFEDEDFTVRRAAIDVVAGHTKASTARLLLDEILLEKKNKKRTLLRAGVAEALGGMGRKDAYGPILALLAEKDDQLRLAGVGALGRLRDERACPALSGLAADPDATYALAALDALSSIGSPDGAEDAVLGALGHEDWRVRSRSIDAVVSLPLKSGIRSLIDRMELEEGRLRGDCYKALKYLTLRDFGDDPATWRTWWDRTESDWTLPDFEEVKKAIEKAAVEGTSYTKGGKSFATVETTSENILFVIDVSGSMETPFGDPDRLAATGREYHSLQRLEIVKEELIYTIQELPDTTSFNVIAFAHDVESWKKTIVRANVLNKNNAITWIKRLKPKGGRAATFRQRTGLEDITDNSEGSTNTHLALMSALGEDVDDKRKGPRSFVIEEPDSELDTIFFLTDGEPTIGKSVDMFVIRQEVRRVNEYKGIQIHVIYVGEFGGEDFEDLARENGGVFVAIGG